MLRSNKPTQEEDSTTSLLSSDHPNPSQKHTSTIILISLVLITCISLSAASAFAFLFFSSSSSSSNNNAPSSPETSRPLSKLKHPVVILMSSDGFRFGYQFKTPTPNINRLINQGTEAETGLIPSFPTLTFPNHYTIATGLYPAYHGIIHNRFIDPHTGDEFTMKSLEPHWWLGEPLWVTVANNGLRAATYFWPGSQVHKGAWNCPHNFCMYYDESVPFEDRVDKILSYFDLPGDEIPSFMAFYLHEPDYQGHRVGPDDLNITQAVGRVDRTIGRLTKGLKKRGVYEDVNIILLGDHGMVGTCDKKLIYLDDLAPWITIPAGWVQSYSPLLLIRPPSGVAPSDVVAKINKGLKENGNGTYLKVYLKEDLPHRFHYSASDRIPPIVGIAEEGFKIKQKKDSRQDQECGGTHGYDYELFSMRTIFIGHGPRFDRGRKVQSFQNVEIYNLVTSILNITAAPNNGSSSFADNVLLPDP